MFYHLGVNERDWYTYRVEGGHEHAVPWFLCDGCGGPSTHVGEAYPGVDVTRSPRLAELVGRSTVRQPELDEIRSLLADQVPPGARITPGTRLGPFCGTVAGRPLDVSWHEPWTMFFRMEAVGALRARGVLLPPVHQARLAPKPGKRRTDAAPLYEPQVGLGVALTADSFDVPVRPPCDVCGAARRRIRAAMVVDAASYDPACGDLMRVRNAVTRYVATARFVDAARDAGLTGIVARPLESR